MSASQIWTVKVEPADSEANNMETGEAAEQSCDDVLLAAEMKKEPLEVEHYSMSPDTSDDDDDENRCGAVSSDSSDYGYHQRHTICHYSPPPPNYVWGSRGYMFEPKYSKAEMEERRRIKAERTEKMPWCSCPNCTFTDLEKRKVCCNKGLVAEFMGMSKSNCISTFAGMKNFVLNEEALLVAHHQIMAEQKQDIRQKFVHKNNAMMRFLAYRSFALWINANVNCGKNFSIAIPSCVIRAVRKKFPEKSKSFPRFEIKLEGDFMEDYPA